MVMDLGQAVDNKILLTETSYQLIVRWYYDSLDSTDG